MTTSMNPESGSRAFPEYPPLEIVPQEDPNRTIIVRRPDTDESLPHYGVVGDTYTILLSGADTDGRYGLIDMHIPPGGGHRYTATTSRRCSTSLRERSSSPSAANRSPPTQGKPSTYQRVHPTNSRTFPQRMHGC